MTEPAEYWLVSGTHKNATRGEKPTGDALLKELSSQLKAFAETHKFNIPELKVGTLDDLVALSDRIPKVNQVMEGVVRKCSTTLQNLLVDHMDKLSEALTVDGESVDSSIKNFRWNTKLYFLKNSTTDLVDELQQTTSNIDVELKKRMSDYMTLKSQLNQIERGQSGNLFSRSLVEIVKREDVVADSEFLQTLFVAVPSQHEEEWKASYNTLTDMVVPNSSKKIAGESDYCLYSVTMFKRVVTDFTNAAREKKFTVRDFEYNPEALGDNQDVQQALNAKITKNWASLVRWTKFQFSDAVSCWLHLKAITVHVESILRYGLPPTYESFVILPKKQATQAKVRTVLADSFKHLESVGSRALPSDDAEAPEVAGVSNEYHSYVSYSFNTDFLKK